MIITSNQMLPAVGELYRHRASGRLVRVTDIATHSRSVHLHEIVQDKITSWWVDQQRFWDEYIHAEARNLDG